MKRLSWPVLLCCLLLVSCVGGPENDQATSPSGGQELFFATSPGGNSVVMEALYQGPLLVRESCVLIGSHGDYTVPVWPDGFTAERDGSGRLVVRDGERVVATEGENFKMGGGYVAEFRPADKVEPREDQLHRVQDWLGYPIPERCLGSEVYGVWIVGET
jgi:hypothetical protein